MKLVNLALQSEYSFRQCYGRVEDLIPFAVDGMLGIADINNTFSHVRFEKVCKKNNIKAIFGVRLYVVGDLQQKRIPAQPWIFIARNNEGLQELYKLVAKAWDQFYYFPKLLINNIPYAKGNILSISSGYPIIYSMSNWKAEGPQYKVIHNNTFLNIAIQANNYLYEVDKPIYEILAGRRGDTYIFNSATYPQHVVSEGFSKESIEASNKLALDCNVELPKAKELIFPEDTKLSILIKNGALKRGINLKNGIYLERVQKEWNLIIKKNFKDYFLIVADMVQYAKRNMLVGPARGSSAGSLICYLLEITEIDPIKHNLIFERFLDVNRSDPPDIDIDFPDVKRAQVIAYLKKKYGENNVQNLCTINTIKPKTALNDVGKVLGCNEKILHDAKESLIEGEHLKDSLNHAHAVISLFVKYPDIEIALKLEGHAQHAGKHAAGVLISNESLDKYGSINSRDGVIQIDKKNAAYFNLLKIDCLGLKTLSIIMECLDKINKPYEWIYNIPPDDAATLQTFRDHNLKGIFQFEGYALASVTKEINVTCFEDLVAITALARPGATQSGGTEKYISRASRKEDPEYYSTIHKKITQSTFGITIYQEQMMEIAREIGKLSWEDVSELRKAVNSKNSQAFKDLKEKFLYGATYKIGYNYSILCWEDLASCGSYLFNRSHAVSYSIISYWTAYFKVHYPLQYSCAYLNYTKDNNTAIKFLREMVDIYNIEYIPVDSDYSEMNWSIHEGKLIGGLTNIDGIGTQKATQIINARKGDDVITNGLFQKLLNPITDFDTLFPIMNKFSVFIEDKQNGLFTLDKVSGRYDYKFICKIVDINPIQSDKGIYLNLYVEDDYDEILCRIPNWKYEEFGMPLVEAGIEELADEFFLVTGSINSKWRNISVSTITYWTGNQFTIYAGEK